MTWQRLQVVVVAARGGSKQDSLMSRHCCLRFIDICDDLVATSLACGGKDLRRIRATILAMPSESHTPLGHAKRYTDECCMLHTIARSNPFLLTLACAHSRSY